MEQTSRARIFAGLVAVVAVAGLAVLSIWSVFPPAPAGADAPAGQFSADRAFAHVERIGSEVHVTGSAEADNARTYLEATLRGLGLQTELQEAIGATDALGSSFALARVRNLIAVMPGTESTGRVFLVAHYDSVQVSPGANDDGAGVATLLETARALSQGPRPRNDVVFVFTDAEEACLCGAEAFVGQHPLAADGGVVLNVEARGSSGPAIMFETSPGNAGVVAVYADAAPYPVGTSFAVEVYRILPNDTDFTPFLAAGRFTGLNTAYIDGSAVYHTPRDLPSYLDKSSLQHHGANALALTRAFAAADLRELAQPSAADATYFPAITFLVQYPAWLIWPLAALALLAVVLLSVLAIRRGRATWPRIAVGFGLALAPLVLVPVAAQVLWAVLVAVRPGYGEMLDPWRPEWFRAGVVALTGAVLLTWYALLRRRVGPWPLAIAGLGWLAVVGVALAAVTPGGSYLGSLPALAGAVACAVALSVRRPLAALVAVTLGAAVAVIILAPTVALFLPALGLATGGAAALLTALLGLALLPVLDWVYPEWTKQHRMWSSAPAVVAGALAVAFTATGLAVDRFDASRPAPAQLMYALDADTGQARWVSTESDPGDWTSRYVTAREDLSAQFPILGDDVFTGPAQVAALPPPQVAVVSDVTSGTHRTLTVRLTPQRDVRLIYVRAGSATAPVSVATASVDGRPLPVDQVSTEDGIGVLFHSPGPDGVTITLGLVGAGPIELRVMDGSDGLDGLPGFAPRPQGVGVRGSHASELVLIAKTYIF